MFDANTIDKLGVWFSNLFDANTIGVIGVGFSIFLCARSASTFLKERPTYFTVLALLALSWALLNGYYSKLPYCEPSSLRSFTMSQHEIFSSLKSFVFVYIGGILSQKARDARQQGTNISRVSYMQVLAFPLLLIIIGVISIPFDGIFEYFKIDPKWKGFGVFILLGFLGLVSLLHGWFKLFGRCFYNLIVALVLSVYFCCSALYRYLEIFGTLDMTRGWALTVAALKIIVTLLLAYRLSIEGMTPEGKKRPFRTFVFKQLPVWLRPVGY